MIGYDLCIAWNWPPDAQFVHLLERACHARGLSTLCITPNNLAAAHQALLDGELGFWVLLDRATDTDAEFAPINQWALNRDVLRINPLELEARSADKATMHMEFLAAGLHTPYTIILPPALEKPTLPAHDLSPLGESFTIKPANGGGGLGVICEACSWEQALAARQELPGDKYLLQAHVTPAQFNGSPAWFRVLYCTGDVFPCWWPPETHIYRPVTPDETIQFGLGALYGLTVQIAQVCRLHYFSTEMALTTEGELMPVDYVNDQIDLRLQSHVADGVPDSIVDAICQRLADLVWQRRLSS